MKINDAPDCRYFSEGNCAKGLPGTPCERKGCEAYYPRTKIPNPLLTMRIPYVKGESLKDIDYSVNIPKETSKNE